MTPIISNIAAPFLVIDSAIQRAVDAGAFVLMRRGVSKGAIRYVVTVAYAASLVVDVAAVWPYSATHPGSSLLGFGCAASWVFAANLGARMDSEAEGGQTRSRADAGWNGIWRAVALGMLGVALLPGDLKAIVAVCNHAQVAAHHWTLVGQWVLFAIIVYLKQTPPKAPPRKVTARVPAGLATEGA